VLPNGCCRFGLEELELNADDPIPKELDENGSGYKFVRILSNLDSVNYCFVMSYNYIK